jgi:trans-aconitate 2-methyltransferase
MTTVWDPAQYARYKTYRDRPALDLMAQIPAELNPREIWDLGCGPGEHAALLSRRYPDARVHGLDSSPDMLGAARQRPEAVAWVEGSIADWSPEVAPDLIFTNAALQWVPDHAALIPRLVGTLDPGGVFACQLPKSHSAAWYELLRETVADPRWADRLADARAVLPLLGDETYYDLLSRSCDGIDLWSTTYLHVLAGEDPVVDWMLGTGLRPYVQAFSDPAERAAFVSAYGERVSRAFPRRADGTTLFPFPRLFLLARRA